MLLEAPGAALLAVQRGLQDRIEQLLPLVTCPCQLEQDETSAFADPPCAARAREVPSLQCPINGTFVLKAVLKKLG